MAPMEKKILLAVDGSVNSRAMLDYVARIRRHLPGLTCCLFHVQSGLSPLLVEEAEHDPRVRAQLGAIADRNETRARRVLDESLKRLLHNGVPADAIEAITQPRVLGLARDIIVRAETTRYDAIAVGRRGLSGLQKLFMGSLTAKLCAHCEIIPIWVVDGDSPADGFIVAVDGSQNALRAVDHTAFMLTGNRTARVTMLNVVSRFQDPGEIDFDGDPDLVESALARGGRRFLDRFIAVATARLQEAGLDPTRIDFKQIKRTAGIGRAILDIARRGRLGTVVIGRRGSGGAFYSGRVCRYVMEKSVQRAFWLVP